MKALRLYGVGDVRLTTEAEPVPGPGEALLRVTSVGLCGSDLHWFSEAGIGDAQARDRLVDLLQLSRHRSPANQARLADQSRARHGGACR